MYKSVSKKYVRDDRSPKPLNRAVSRVMSANKAKGTGLELKVRKLLVKNGMVGYRLNWGKVPGKPDIAYPSKKVAVFINGCFWHACKKCDFKIPKTNSVFWKNKFTTNRKRDKSKIEILRKLGWKTYTIWECELKNDQVSTFLRQIRSSLRQHS